MSFLKKSQEHGLTEILFSLHGFDDESHNKAVGTKFAYKRILQAIRNANILGIKVRINCTVTYDNYQDLDRFACTIAEFDIFEVNFLPLNYWDDASGSEVVDYNVISPYIKETIDTLKSTCIVNVRYIPFCFMVGYEEHVCDTYQHIYDIYDWNIAMYDDLTDPQEYKQNKTKVMFDVAKKNIDHAYYKKSECVNCKFFNICDGIEKQLDIDLYPQQGKKITDVNFYRKEFYKTQHTDTHT